MSIGGGNHCITFYDLESVFPYSTTMLVPGIVTSNNNPDGQMILYSYGSTFYGSAYFTWWAARDVNFSTTYPTSTLKKFNISSLSDIDNCCIPMSFAHVLFGRATDSAYRILTNSSSTGALGYSVTGVNTAGPFKFTPVSGNDSNALVRWGDITINNTLNMYVQCFTGSAGAGISGTKYLKFRIGPYDTSSNSRLTAYEIGADIGISSEGSSTTRTLTGMMSKTIEAFLHERTDAANLKTYIAITNTTSYSRNGRLIFRLESSNGTSYVEELSTGTMNVPSGSWNYCNFTGMPFLEMLNVFGWRGRFGSGTADLNNFIYLYWKYA
jgi:hypothetical protein